MQSGSRFPISLKFKDIVSMMLLIKRCRTLSFTDKRLVPELLLSVVTLTVIFYLSCKAKVYLYLTGKLKFFCRFNTFGSFRRGALRTLSRIYGLFLLKQLIEIVHHKCWIGTQMPPFTVQSIDLLTSDVSNFRLLINPL